MSERAQALASIRRAIYLHDYAPDALMAQIEALPGEAPPVGVRRFLPLLRPSLEDDPMTPTPREDTMTEQTEQEPKKPVALRASNVMGHEYVYFADDIEAYVVALVRERDAQIANMGANQLVLQEAVATQSDLIVTLRAERDAAQQAFERCREVQQTTAEAWRVEHEEMTQQIATLTEALKHIANAPLEGATDEGAWLRDCARAALQSTRKEQP